MKLSLSWLKDFVDIDAEPDRLADLLTMAGIEVEGIEQTGVDFPHVVVGEILSSDKHPSADRLSVCQVNVGGEPRQIVCGAKNYQVGDRVPVALPGAVLPGDFRIKESKLRGELSQGMMCSGRELGLAQESDGLLILDPATVVGTPIGEVFPADTVFDLEITPNRPDLLSHHGIARELVILGAAQWTKDPDAWRAEAELHALPADLVVDIADAEACPTYTATLLDVPEVGQSPAWITRRLTAVGLRPINVLVDITNYVMLEVGHPMHVFDVEKLRGGEIVHVRDAQAGEAFEALDHRSYELADTDLVIADGEGPVALAGVIGGTGSAVTEGTRRVLLEVARFHPSRVRAARTRLNVSTDSSFRFERGTDDATLNLARARAVKLLEDVAGATLVATNLPEVPLTEREPVTVRPERVSQVLGVDLGVDEVRGALSRVSPSVAQDEIGTLVCAVPAHRHDLTREADFIEEVARIVGLDRVPSRLASWPAASTPVDSFHDAVLELKRSLVAQGFYEVVTNPLGLEGNGVALLNPMTSDQTGLRASVREHLLRVAAANFDAGNRSLRLFEVGRVFRDGGEAWHLGLLVSGEVSDPAWNVVSRSLDAHDLTGVAAAEGLAELDLEQVSPAELKRVGIKQPVAFAETSLTNWLTLPPATFVPWPAYPASTRDAAVVVPRATPYAEIQQATAQLSEPLLEAVELVDVFTDDSGERLDKAMKSMTLTMRYRSAERTLTDKEVNDAQDRVKLRLSELTGCGYRA